MQETTRETAAAMLLGRVLPELASFAGVPPFLRARAARRAAVQVLAEGQRLTALEQGALVHAASADADVQVRASAVTALGCLAPPSLAIPVLVACTADREESVRSAAQAELTRLQSSEARVVELVPPAAKISEPRVPRFIAH
jgi:HEAT repeat protein